MKERTMRRTVTITTFVAALLVLIAPIRSNAAATPCTSLDPRHSCQDLSKRIEVLLTEGALLNGGAPGLEAQIGSADARATTLAAQIPAQGDVASLQAQLAALNAQLAMDNA